MSESFPPPDRPAKRQRTDGDLRRQRKREADRMAQKNSRERRRTYIDHLENTISILRKDNRNTAVCELTETVRQLRAENERLRKIINNARASLSLTDCELSPPSPKASPESNIIEEVRDSSPQCATVEPPPHKDSETSETVNQPMTDAILSIRPDIANAHAQSLAQSGARVSGTRSNGLSDGTLHFTDSWMDKNSAVRGRRNPSAIDPYLWLGSITPASPRLSVNVVRCPIWERSNRIYSQITQATPADASGALQLGSAHYADMIFKAVLNGWDALNGQEQRNPILRTLRDIDQVFPQLDPISRSAFMYKSHKLLRYHLDPEKRNLEDMPEWQRPLSSQRTKQHPIAIDFFAWPALRERLVDSNHGYFATSDFSAHFCRYYKFDWPFSFEDTYIYDREADTYRLSPIFERYHRNIKYWGVEKPFLDRFPELVHDITICDSPESSVEINGNEPKSSITGDGTFTDNFMEREMITELFDDYPQIE